MDAPPLLFQHVRLVLQTNFQAPVFPVLLNIRAGKNYLLATTDSGKKNTIFSAAHCMQHMHHSENETAEKNSALSRRMQGAMSLQKWYAAAKFVQRKTVLVIHILKILAQYWLLTKH